MTANLLSTSAVTFFALILLFIMIEKNTFFDFHKKRSFCAVIAVTSAVAASEAITGISESGAVMTGLSDISNVIGFGASPVIPMLLSSVFSVDYSKKTRPTYIPIVLNLVFSLLSPFFGLVFSVNKYGEYSRGPLFWFFIATTLWSVGVFFIRVIANCRKYYTKSVGFFVVLFIFLLLGCTIQVIFPSIHTTWICIVIALFAYYAFACEYSDRHDALTTLFNRREFETEKTALGEKDKATVIMFDADEFKAVNDNHGHGYGDYCLNAIGTEINNIFSVSGTGFRIGGDEFCVFSKVTDSAEIEQLLKEFTARISALREKDESFPMVSYGYDIYRKASGELIDSVIRRADDELYKFKRMRKEKKLKQEI